MGEAVLNGKPEEETRIITPFIPTQDAALSFIKAQSEFIRAQAYYLEVGVHAPDQRTYVDHLHAFTRAQGHFVRAQQDYLAQLGYV